MTKETAWEWKKVVAIPFPIQKQKLHDWMQQSSTLSWQVTIGILMAEERQRSGTFSVHSPMFGLDEMSVV